ncbi:amidohydrolase family protein [Thermodesulfobacteriota bacterium]
MSIDIHRHLLVRDFCHETFWDWYGELNAASIRRSTGKAPLIPEIKKTLMPTWWDPTGQIAIEEMDQAGISLAVLLPLDQGLLFGEADLTIEEQNRRVSEVAMRHPDRFIYFCGVDPRRPGALELFETCVEEWGAKGLKLYPSTGFLPADRIVYPFYERAAAWNMPVLFHTGPQDPPYKSGNAHPSLLLRPLVDFPELTIIAAHLSFEWWRDLVSLGKVRENVMCDFCAWQRAAKDNYDQFRYILRRFLDEFGGHRVMFGTDSPLLDHVASNEQWVAIIRDLPHQSKAPYRFSEEEVTAVLQTNARNLLATLWK